MIEHSLFSNELSSPSNIVVFTAMFLILYVFHLFISWLYYMIANKMAGSMKRKIIVFYLFGLVLLFDCICVFSSEDRLVVVSLFYYSFFSLIQERLGESRVLCDFLLSYF